MFDVAFNGIITANRGDSFSFPIVLNIGNSLNVERFPMDENCRVYFSVMEPNQSFEDALIRKVYTVDDTDENGDIVVSFKPKDTQCVLPGKYYYQVKLKVTDKLDDTKYDVYTIIDKTLFFITE